jgi:hypothetical protein
MDWVAPEVTRIEEPFIACERSMLEGWLDYHRTTLLWKCAGLTANSPARVRNASAGVAARPDQAMPTSSGLVP